MNLFSKKDTTTNSLIKYLVLNDDLINENKEFVRMIKINPIAFNALPEDEQWKYITNLSYVLNIALSKNYQIFSTDEPVDIKNIIKQYDQRALKYNYEDPTDRKRIEVLKDEKDRLAVASIDNEIVLKSYYLILNNKDKSMLDKQINDYRYELNQNGFFCEFVNIKDSTRLLYKYFNPMRSSYEKFPNIFGKEFDINDFLKTDNISLIADEDNQFQSLIRVDGVYEKVFYVAAYDENPDPTFLGNICMVQGCDVSIHVHYENTERIKKEYDEMANELRGQRYKSEKDSELLMLDKSYESTLETLSKIVAEGICGNTIFTTIKLWGDSIDDLKHKIKAIKEHFAKQSIILKEGFNEQLELFKTNSPLGTNYFRNSYSKDVTSDVVGFGFPMVQETYVDNCCPIYIGNTLSSNGPVFYDSSELTKIKLSRNEFLTGLIGSGKTTLFLELMYIRYALGEKQFIIDVEGNQLLNFVREMDGSVVDCSNSKAGGLNPLQVRVEYQSKKENDDAPVILSDIYPLPMHLLFLKNFFRIFLGKLDPSDIERRIIYLDKLLIGLYTEWKITFDTNALEIKELEMRDFPIFSDLYKYSKDLYDDPDYKTIPKDVHVDVNASLMDLAEGTASVMFNCYTNDTFMQSDLVLFDISALNGKDDIMLETHLYNIVSYVWGYIVTDQSGRVIRLNLDELKAAIGGKFSYVAIMLESFSLRCRKHGAGLTVATQQIEDVLMYEYGRTIFSQSLYKFIFKIDELSANSIRNLKSSRYKESDLEFITTKANRGQCLFYSGLGYSHRLEIQLGYLADVFEDFKNK